MKVLDHLRALVRGQFHPGYVWAAVTDDGELLCAPCVRENYRQVFRDTKHKYRTGWQCAGVTGSDSAETTEHCAHCNRVIFDCEDL